MASGPRTLKRNRSRLSLFPSQQDGSSLIDAVLHQEFDAIKEILQNYLDINKHVKSGETLLHEIVKLEMDNEESRLSVVRDLLDFGADVSRKNRFGMTPLLLAVDLERPANLVSLLLTPQSNIETSGPGGLTALHLAARKSSLETVKLLLNAGASSVIVDAMGKTALHEAASAGQAEIAKLLVKRNPSTVALVTHMGETPSQELVILRLSRL